MTSKIVTFEVGRNFLCFGAIIHTDLEKRFEITAVWIDRNSLTLIGGINN